MRARVPALLVLLIAVSSLAAAPSVAQSGADPSTISVELDRSEADAGPGEKLTFVSTLRNTGNQPVTDLVVLLNIVTADPDVYVDPEDWSPRRTQYIDELGPRDSVELTWDVRAVTSGPLVLYVAASYPASDEVAASGPLYLTVSGRRVVNSDNVLPLVLGLPGSVLGLLTLTMLRRGRLR